MFLLKKLPCIYNNNLVSFNHQMFDSEKQLPGKKKISFVSKLRSLSETNKIESSKIDEHDFLCHLSTLYHSQESVPAGAISFDAYLNDTVSDFFTI